MIARGLPGAAGEAGRMRFIAVAIGLVAASNTLGAATHAGPGFALASTAFTSAVMLAWTAYRRDEVLGRWLLLGLVAGWLELVTDAWLVGTGTLVYPQVAPMVWDSPLYMPFAWMLVLSQLGIVAGWLAQRMPLAAATVACALLAGSMIPLYEHLAAGAGYWWYVNTPMVIGAPWYIIVAEFLLSLPLVWMSRLVPARSWTFSALLGAGLGLWMLPSVQLAWWLVGPCQGAWIQLGCS